MTVIVWDGRFVAADSLEVSGCLRTSRAVEKIEVRDGVVYAVTGAAGLHKQLIDWVHEHSADPEKKPSVHEQHQDTAVVVFRDGRCFSYDLKMPYPVECFAPDAWGCGTATYLAIGAMKYGADAKAATEIAIESSTCVGGPVQVIDLHQLQRSEKDAA